MTLTGQIGLLRNGTDFIAQGIQWATYSNTYHTVIAVDDVTCVSAQPGGSRYKRIADYDRVTWSDFDHTPAQRAAIVEAAHAYVPRPYNYAIYPPLLWQRLTGNRVDGAVAEWLSRRPNENCSQLCDDVYTRAGFHLFDDSPVIVTPGDFERLFIRLGFLQATIHH